MSEEIAVKKIKKRKRRRNPAPPNKLAVQTDDGYTFYTDIETLMVSNVLRVSIEGHLKDNEPLRITGMSHDIVQRVLWWMENHRQDKDLKSDENIGNMDAWQRCFFNTTIDIILKLISAANYLDVRRLMVLGINKLAEIINEKFSEDNPVRAIRDVFHIRAPEPSESQQKLNEDISRLFVSERTIRLKENPSKIDVLDVEVTHLPPRRLECPQNPENTN